MKQISRSLPRMTPTRQLSSGLRTRMNSRSYANTDLYSLHGQQPKPNISKAKTIKKKSATTGIAHDWAKQVAEVKMLRRMKHYSKQWQEATSCPEGLFTHLTLQEFFLSTYELPCRKQDLSALSFIFNDLFFSNSVFKLDAVQRCCCLVLFYFCFTFRLLKTYMMLYCALASLFPSHQLHILLHYFYKLDKCILCFKIESALSNCVFFICSLSVMRKEPYIYLFAFTLTLCIAFFF